MGYCFSSCFTYLLHKFKTNSSFIFGFVSTIYIMNSPVKTVSFKQKGNTLCFLALCWHRPIFPVRRQTSIFGSAELNFRVRNGYGWTLCDINTNLQGLPCFLFVSTVLSSRSVARQVFSALQSLTSVFGMGTGGPSVIFALTSLVHLQGFEPGTH